LFVVSVPDAGAMTVEDLKNYCLAEARRVGAALPEHGSASSPSGTSIPRITVISWETCGWITDFWLSDAVTGERFPEDLRVNQTELSDGDLLILSIRYKPDGAYCLIRTPNPPTMLHWLRLAEIPAAPVVTPRLWGALLYTEADVELATYVRTHFDDLNALSGSATRIFVVERRTNWSTAKKYWRRHLEPELYRAMSTLRWLQWTPYDAHGAYEIADLLGVSAELLPCLVFFHSPEGPQREGEKIVFRIEHTSTEYFRSLFGRINTVLRPFLASAQPSQDRSHGRYRGWSYSSIYIHDFEDPEAEPGSHKCYTGPVGPSPHGRCRCFRGRPRCGRRNQGWAAAHRSLGVSSA